jgi:UDP-N-acetyl-D-galactosamine dehydrogenase
MGLTFKENCPDLRNTQVVELIEEFKGFNCNVDVYDPWVDKDEALNVCSVELVDQPLADKYDAVILAVAHDEFKELSLDAIKSFGKDNFVLYDIKYLLDVNEVNGRL